jgi:hypothetical protein
MALNLNKNEDEKTTSSLEKNGLDLSKSADSKSKGLNLTKTEESPTSAMNLSKEKLRTESILSESETLKNKKKKFPLLFYVILAAIIIGIFWFKNTNQTTPVVIEAPAVSNDSVSSQADISSDSVKADQTISSSPSASQAQSNVGSVNSSNGNENKSNISSDDKIKADNNSSISDNQLTIDEKAKQVMDGVFGNGIDRKNALGNEYYAIQAKVNEICRKR